MKAIKEKLETGTYRGRWNYSGYFYVYFWSTGSTKQSICIGGTGQHC